MGLSLNLNAIARPEDNVRPIGEGMQVTSGPPGTR